jgi:hypothetical protein
MEHINNDAFHKINIAQTKWGLSLPARDRFIKEDDEPK